MENNCYLTPREGELLFERMARNSGYQTKDVSGIKTYQKQDIDFVVYNPHTQQARNFEVKTDKVIHRTGNIYCETYVNHSINHDNLGWYAFSKADYIVYIDALTRAVYQIDFNHLKEVCESKPRKKHICCKGNDYSEGYLVNLSELKYKVLQEGVM